MVSVVLNLFKVNSKTTRTAPIDIILVSLLDTFTCLKSTIETLKKGLKYLQW